MISILLERMYESGPLGRLVSTAIVGCAFYYLLTHIVVVIK